MIKDKKQPETVMKQCMTCLTVYQVPATAGCTICPGCGQRSCGD